MDLEPVIADLSLVDEVVLLGVAVAESNDETPVRLDEVRATCNGTLAAATGRLAESDVARSLNALAATALVGENDAGAASPVGKGRPHYHLECEVTALFETLATEEQLEPMVESVRQ